MHQYIAVRLWLKVRVGVNVMVQVRVRGILGLQSGLGLVLGSWLGL